MYQTQEMQHMVDLNKAAFQVAAHSLDLFQDQAEQFAEIWMNQTFKLPKNWQKAYFDWFKLCKKERKNYKNFMEQELQRVEAFVQGKEPVLPKRKKEETAKKSDSGANSK